MIRYFTLDTLLYAYDTNSGLTLKYVDNQWMLSDITYAFLVTENSVQEIYDKEAMKITNNISPNEFIKKFMQI